MRKDGLNRKERRGLLRLWNARRRWGIAVVGGGVGVTVLALMAILRSGDHDAATREGTGPDHPTPPYPTSAVITDLTFDDSTLRIEATGSDNWPITWGSDGHLFTSWGDGGGFGGTDSRGRVSLGVARIQGAKGRYVAVNVAGGVNAPYPSPFSGKSVGILAVGQTLYMWRNGNASGRSAFHFSRLYRSDDHGASWLYTGIEFSRRNGSFLIPDQGFFSPTFSQFGPGYRGNPDGFVYIFAPELVDSTHWKIQKPGRIALMRVPVDSLEYRESYELFAGLDGTSPRWTHDISKRYPTWQDLQNGTHRMAVSYNPFLRRYLLSTMTVSREGWLGLYESQFPWGPWKTVYFAQDVERWGRKTIIFSFVNKWLSQDGTRFVVAFTRNDSWATIEGSLNVSREMIQLELDTLKKGLWRSDSPPN